MSTFTDAFFAHVDHCVLCSWAGGRFCRTAMELIDEQAQKAAELLAPVPVLLPRPEAKS